MDAGRRVGAVATVIAFDYLHSRRPTWLRVMWDAPSTQYRAPIAALLCTIAVALAACMAENARLERARQLAESYRTEMRVSAAALGREHVQARRMREVIRADEELRRIARSGDVEAGRLAELAQLLPLHARLTAIRREGGSVVLEGRAASFSVVARTMLRLSHARALGAPQLDGTQAVTAVGKPAEVVYTLRAEVSP